MTPYLELVQRILEDGYWQDNRTGVRTISFPGAMLRFDLRQGFPAITTRRLAFRSAMGELVGFLRARRSAADFRALGCKVWDQNANENAQWLANPFRQGTDDLGAVYGVQWRQWPAYKIIERSADAQRRAALAHGYEPLAGFTREGRELELLGKDVDQLKDCLETLIRDPGSRRILFHAWNPATLDEIALPACHLLYQFLPNAARRELSLCLYIRSNDVGLGTPFNLAEGAALLHLVARLTGYQPRWFSYFIGDAHIYENQIPMLQTQLQRRPFPLPQLRLHDRIPDYAATGRFEPEWLERVEPEDFSLEGYQHHDPLTAPMAV